MDKGSWGGTEWGPYFLRLVRGVSRQTCSEPKDGNYLDLLGKARATAGQLPICQLLANWYGTLWNPKSPLRDLLISGRVYTWFLRFLELIEFSLEYFLPSPSALNCAWVKVHSEVTGFTKSVYLGASISFLHAGALPPPCGSPALPFLERNPETFHSPFFQKLHLVHHCKHFIVRVVLHTVFSLRFCTSFAYFVMHFFLFQWLYFLLASHWF